MILHILRFSLILLLVSCPFTNRQVHAASAIPTPIVVEQADATKLTIRLYGDEFFSYKTTLDGYLIEEDNTGNYYYVSINTDNNVVRSSVAVHEIEKRTIQEQKFLKSLNNDEIIRKIKANANPDALRSNRSKSQLRSQGFPAFGDKKALIILVEFADNSFTVAEPTRTFSNMLNQPGYSFNGATGSSRDYFIENSSGKFSPQFDVFGPVKVSKEMAYYGAPGPSGNDSYPQEMVYEACQLMAGVIDFSQYDNDNDGKVDNVYVYYAGYGEADGGHVNTIWPHSSDIEDFNLVLNGVLVSRYACSAELKGGKGTNVCGIGTFTHEFMHVLGFPDLYETNYVKRGSFTPGGWSVLDVGNYNNEQNTPPYMSVYERYKLGWLEPEELNTSANITLTTINNNKGYKISTGNPNEYYLFENRQQKGWDTYIPGHGMLVWHIDYNEEIWRQNRVNNEPDHQRVDIVEADGTQTQGSRDGDSYPGVSGIRSFTDYTNPAMKTWAGTPLNRPIEEIVESDGIISFKLMGGKNLSGKINILPAEDIKQTGFTAHWNTFEDAAFYLIDIYKINGDFSTTLIEDFEKKNVGTGTSFTIEGLEPGTNYGYKITAADAYSETEASDMMTFKTLDATFEYFIPIVKKATNITENSFVANWEQLQQASSYIINVYKKNRSEAEEDITVDFTGKIAGIPIGWSTNCTSVFSTEGYFGKASPALRMDIDKHYFETPMYEKELSTFSFWYRGYNSVTQNSLVVSAFNGQKWVELRTIQPLNNALGGETISFDVDDLAGYYAVSLRLNKSGTGGLALDDVSLSYGIETSIEKVTGYDALNVGNALSWTVNDLEKDVLYYYTINGFNGNVLSKTSGEMEAKPTTGAGIDNDMALSEISISGNMIHVKTNNLSIGHLEIYNVMGHLVHKKQFDRETSVSLESMLPGVYLLKLGIKTYKFIIKQ